MESPTRKRSHADMTHTVAFDDDRYKWEVRRIPLPGSESDLDAELQRAALLAGIELPTQECDIEVEAIDSSISGLTITSDNTNVQSSIMTESTAPTSCSSSERRPPTGSSVLSATVEAAPPAEVYSPTSSKRNSVFRARMRKMVRLGKKEQNASEPRVSSPETTSSATSPAYSGVQLLPEEAPRVPSIRSHKSNWSITHLPTPAQEEDVDPAALERSLECREMTARQKEQLEERERFIGFRAVAMEHLARERFAAKSEKRLVHDAVLQRKREQDQQAIEQLENKHLAEELRMSEEHRFREQMMNSRLRRIEKFVHHPTPPPTPATTEQLAETSSTESENTTLPARTTRPADYNHLAEQYREQRNLLHVNISRINVLRGQQQKKVDMLVEQKDREMEAIEKAQAKEMALIDAQFDSQDKALAEALNAKRALLELYWLRCACYEQERQERSTGLKFQALPPVTIE